MSSPKTVMEFEKAMTYMDPMQVTDYLHKILDFLKRNNTELCFPNISQYVEAFLVNLVNDTRNLKCKSFKGEEKSLALEIIEVLEMSRDVFRWAYSYENGIVNKNFLTYKKIFTNKIKNANGKKSIKPSSIAHRLIQARDFDPPTNSHILNIQQTNKQTDLPALSTGFKLAFLNKTLRFIKSDDEVTLYYNEMPLAQAEYIQSLIQTPNSDNDVGFGFKSLYAPLWEAMEEQSVNFMLKTTLQLTHDSGTAVLKFEKIPRKNNYMSGNDKERHETVDHSINNVTHIEGEVSRKSRTRRKKNSNKQKMDKSLNTSTGSTSSLPSTCGSDPNAQLLRKVSSQFMKDTVLALTHFASDAGRASVSFEGLTQEELGFVKKVKGWAASPEMRDNFSHYFRGLLLMLNSSITEALKTCKITTIINEKDRGITLKKTPLFSTPAPVKHNPVSARSKSLAATKSRDRSLSKDRIIQFHSANSATKKIDPVTDKESTDKPVERGRTKDKSGLNKRTAKLLEDMATPVESDRGIRMMLLMGWDGGALGSRGDGIIEPIIPLVDLPPKAGLGHVPPPKVYQRRPVEFRMTLLHNMHDFLLHDDSQKQIQYQEPLTKKEKKFIPAALQCFNARRPAGLWAEEADLQQRVLQALARRPDLALRADIAQDLKTVTLLKVKNDATSQPTSKPAGEQKQKKKKKMTVQIVTDEDIDVLITSYDIEAAMTEVDTSLLEFPALKAIRKRAARIVFLKKITEVVEWESEEIRFKFKGTLQNTLVAFLQAIVRSLNNGIRDLVIRYCSHNLIGVEHQLYEDLWRRGSKWQLWLEFENKSLFMLTKKPLISEDKIYGSVAPKVRDNNNDDMTDNRNHTQNVKGKSQENNADSYTAIKEIDDNDSAVTNKDINNDNNKEMTYKISLNKCNDNETLTYNHSKTNRGTENNNTNETNLNIVARTDNDNLVTSSDINGMGERIQGKIEPEHENIALESDSVLNIKQEIEANSNEETDFFGNTLVLGNGDLSDLDRDIQDLELAIGNADIAFNIKKENDTDTNQSDLEIAILNTELGCDVKTEIDTNCDLDRAISDADLCFDVTKGDHIDTSSGSKRSRTNLNSSEELDPKRTKITIDDSEIIVIISPKDPDEKINRDFVRQVQSLISDEIDQVSGFLPLLKCHCVQNDGLVYSCHDYDDVAWLKNAMSAANLDIVVVSSDDLCLKHSRRILSMKINSFLHLDAKKTFNHLEIYNVGLETKSWKVLLTNTVSKTMANTFYFFLVEVDEKSLKYISDENFSLYCGTDKANFSIIL